MDVKLCTKCKELKPLTLFGTRIYKDRSYSKVYYRARCNPCRVKETQKAYTPEVREYRKLKRQNKKKELVARFENKCLDCQNTFPYYVYEFHHLEDTKKDYSIGKILLDNHIKLENEISKCVMLCANCHKIRHNKDR